VALGQLGWRGSNCCLDSRICRLFLLCCKFGNYDKSFGSLGAVVGLLIWLYVSAYVVLAGACLNAEMERQTARDTTTGRVANGQARREDGGHRCR
jgi:hypothetical protein